MCRARFLRQFGTTSVSPLFLIAKAFYALSKNVLGSVLRGGGRMQNGFLNAQKRNAMELRDELKSKNP